MPRIAAEKLRAIGYDLFQAAGCSRQDAESVVDHLVESNLFGHDSHGAILFARYVAAIRDGRFNAQARPQVVQETACTAVIDGRGALGQVGGALATELAIRKARRYGTASVALRNTSHVGRVGAYPLMAARAGMIGLAFVNGGRLGYQIAPYGGLDGKLSTNPIAFAAPRPDGEPIVVDAATSVVAEGKIRVALHAGKSVPEGWLIDHEGRPTTDPRRFYDEPRGAILPLGGPAGHKGYGLSLMVEILGGALSGEGCAAGQRQLRSNGVLLCVYHIEHFVPPARYDEELRSLVAHVRSSRPAPGVDEILLPGEPEFRTARRRQREGIEIAETTWSEIVATAGELGLDPGRWESVEIAG